MAELRDWLPLPSVLVVVLVSVWHEFLVGVLWALLPAVTCSSISPSWLLMKYVADVEVGVVDLGCRKISC